MRTVGVADLEALSSAYTLGNDQVTDVGQGASDGVGHVPAERTSQASQGRIMVCSFCAGALGEIKTLGGFGPCACCGKGEHTSGPITPEELRACRERLERLAAIGQGIESVAAGEQAPAGIVRLAGEELFEAIESEEDIVNANRELTEGRPLTDEESKRWQRLVHEIQRECNVRLKAKGIVLLAGVPEPNGLGFVLTGCDKAAIEAAERGISMPSEEYTVTITLPARERVDIARTEREDFVRKFIDLICSECIEQQKAYRAKREFFN